ncbi:MAG: TatD family hydrolase [Prevotellaceae bacterium]|jgi:TatD DNase family protein|nr:TatD family hydrolase [Prevotellaceae bacterium]
MIDTHCHIFDEAFDADRVEVIARAQSAGVTQMLMPNIDKSTFAPLMRTAREYSGYCYPMIGLHPTSVKDDWEDELLFVEQQLRAGAQGTFVAIGEIGIDGYWSKEFLEEQKIVFARQLELAELNNLPVVIHARDSFNEIFDVLRKEKRSINGVFHAFSGSIETYHEIKRSGNFMVGIGGMVTFKTAKLPHVVAQIPLSDILLETDSPYLTPAPHRGKRNESSYLEFVAQKIAEVKNIAVEEVKEVTARNAIELFKLQE